jgi:LmbE family N-acetylglucosaminyl deacetylase
LTSEPKAILARATAGEGDPSPAPRALLVFAHPDDETVALGARIGRFLNSHFILVTDGAPRNQADSLAHGFPSFVEYRAARARELSAMLQLAGVGQMSRECFDIPDQEVSLQLPEFARRLAQRIREVQPQVVITHPYEGGHPDHDACAFAVHQACALAAAGSGPQPLIVEAAFYHAGAHGIETETFLSLPSPLLGTGPVPEVVHALAPAEQASKRERMACFVTQRATLEQFPCLAERYRVAPSYDFARPPHPGPAFYDHFPWGMTSGRFCRVAAEAMGELREEMRR